MISDQSPVVQSEKTLPMGSTSQGNVHPTNVRVADVTPATTQVDQKRVFDQNKVEKEAVEGRINPSLSRLLIGGLVGATIGAIAGALTNRKTSQGFKHAVQGVDRASKTIGEGLSQAASGVVDATKSVGEGVGYAISGSTQDAVQGIAEGTQQIKTVVTEVAQTTVNQADRTVKGVAKGAQQAKTATLEAVQATTERVGRTAQETSENVKATAKEVSKSVQQASDRVPQTKAVVPAQSDADIELMDVLQDKSTMTNTGDELEAEIITMLQEDEDSPLNGFFISEEGKSQEEIEQAIQEGAEAGLQDNVFADVEISRPVQ